MRRPIRTALIFAVLLPFSAPMVPAADGPRITLLTEKNQFANPGHLLWEPLLIRADDADGKPMEGIRISFSVSSRDGKFLQTTPSMTWTKTITVHTDRHGLAQAHFCAPPGIGSLSTVALRVGKKQPEDGWRIRNVDDSRPPGAPINVEVETESDSDLLIKWQPTSDNATHFRIERSDDNQTWITVGAVAASVTIYRDKVPEPGRPYSYRLVSVN